MGDRTKIQQKKAVTSTYSQPTLAQKSIQGFDLSSFSPSQSIASSPSHDISKISLRPQAKLTVGQPGDIYEQEADNVAEQVMRMTIPETLEFSSAQTAQNSLQRKCAACENEETEEIQRKPTLQRAAESNIQQPNNVESQLSATQGGGSPLSNNVREFMEPRFGADFSQVRVHTGSEAVQMNRDLNAQAFTYGSDVYYGAGKVPGKDDLTAHELTHVVQQTGSIQAKGNAEGLIQRSNPKEENVIDLGETTIYSNETEENRNVIDLGETTIYSNEAEENSIDPLGYETGLGVVHVEGNQKEKIDYLSANAKLGRFGKPNQDMRIGSQVDAQYLNFTTGNNGLFGGSLGFDGGAFGANADNSVGEDGFALGGQVYAAQEAVRVGDVSSSEVNDEQFRLGYGQGIGWSARGHWGDQDKDDRKEIGFGADIGPISFDVKTEDPALTLLKGVAPGVGWAIDALTDDKKFNLTDKALKILGIKDKDDQK
ncbi:MAG: DUF4157 domain-containing protein [Cyanomargarita calcarea GSE-NOS-MK-12-04C]|jgi:hypothetical protein|uniref:DUF4157 domain-containing protein n=1 Tax=Cyanomargarita calcarea GSE-NOS-MK-12-04C TaxID=2839659 RepID=A0A951QUV0_9CYAN|nr:DUF4157 domain-containing protein [Cyanomargarita calcarea GSE-NOS-MK-12-04C]